MFSRHGPGIGLLFGRHLISSKKKFRQNPLEKTEGNQTQILQLYPDVCTVVECVIIRSTTLLLPDFRRGRCLLGFHGNPP